MAISTNNYEEVTDPNILRQLNQDTFEEVTDPNILSQLNNKQNAAVKYSPEQLAKMIGLNTTPMGNVRDVLSGIATTGQSLGNLFTGGRGTHFDFQSPNVNPIAEKFGEFLPATIMGGPNVLGQMFTQGLTGYANATPEQKNLFGLLPKGKMGSAIENALLVGIPGSLFKGGRMLYRGLSQSTPEILNQSIQAHHDSLLQSAQGDFQHVVNEVKNRNVPNIKISKDIIKQLRTPGYFPKTEATKKLIQDVEKGDYNALRDAQSDLFHEGNRRNRSPLSSERNQGKEMHDLRDKINNIISEHLIKTGNTDLNEILESGKNKYFNLKDLYNAKGVPPAIKKLVDKDYREIPPDIYKTLSKTSKPINKLKEANPEIEKQLLKEERRKNALNTLKKLTHKSADLTSKGLLGAGLYKIYDLAKNKLMKEQQ